LRIKGMAKAKDPIKVYDARWEINEFNDHEVIRLFEASLGYAKIVGADTLVMTRDARLGCARVMEIGIKVAVEAGFRIFVCFDPISTPLSYFVTMQTSLLFPQIMSLTVTASHNPKQYIGIKYTVPGVEAIGYDCGPSGGLKKIKELYHKKDFILKKSGGGTLTILQNPVDEYINYTYKLTGLEKGRLHGLSVILDTFNGSAGPELYRALTGAGVEVTPLKLVPNGEFPTGSPNPTSQNKMKPAMEIARRENADLIIGIDGDGDRIVFGDQKGVFSAGFVMVPILKSILLKENNSCKLKVLYDPKVNPMALLKWAEMEAIPILFRNGHSQIKAFMKETGITTGVEESGHFYHSLPLGPIEVRGENSLYTILLFLKSVHQNKTIISEIRSLQDRIYTSGEFNFKFSDDTVRDQALNEVISLFEKDNARLTTCSDNGNDLGGTVVNKGIKNEAGEISLNNEWYSAYLRIATNEKAVVRSYISSCNNELGLKLREKIDRLLKDQFKGKEIE
jgi:phosphomannomutase